MSARRPKFSPSKSKRKAQKAVPPGSSNLLLLSEAPRTRLPPATAHLAIPRHQTILALPVRKSYVQIQRPRTAQTRHINSEDPSVADNDTFQNDFTNIIFQHSLEDSPNTNAQKRQRQWRQWQLHTIPSLVQPYLDILRKTQSLREKPLLCEPPRCTCMKSRVIKVLCVYFERTYIPPCHPSILTHTFRDRTNRASGVYMCTGGGAATTTGTFSLCSPLPHTRSRSQLVGLR